MLELLWVDEKANIFTHTECDFGLKEEIFIPIHFAHLVTVFYLAEIPLISERLQFPFCINFHLLF
jgi:hypothetical protein